MNLLQNLCTLQASIRLNARNLEAIHMGSTDAGQNWMQLSRGMLALLGLMISDVKEHLTTHGWISIDTPPVPADSKRWVKCLAIVDGVVTMAVYWADSKCWSNLQAIACDPISKFYPLKTVSFWQLIPEMHPSCKPL